MLCQAPAPPSPPGQPPTGHGKPVRTDTGPSTGSGTTGWMLAAEPVLLGGCCFPAQSTTAPSTVGSRRKRRVAQLSDKIQAAFPAGVGRPAAVPGVCGKGRPRSSSEGAGGPWREPRRPPGWPVKAVSNKERGDGCHYAFMEQQTVARISCGCVGRLAAGAAPSSAHTRALSVLPAPVGFTAPKESICGFRATNLLLHPKSTHNSDTPPKCTSDSGSLSLENHRQPQSVRNPPTSTTSQALGPQTQCLHNTASAEQAGPHGRGCEPQLGALGTARVL